MDEVSCSVCFHSFSRGKELPKEYSNLGETRGLLDTSVYVMVMTATVTRQTSKDIFKSLGFNLAKPVMTIRSPEKPNVVYK